jgi:molybdopterin-binding protein
LKDIVKSLERGDIATKVKVEINTPAMLTAPISKEADMA